MNEWTQLRVTCPVSDSETVSAVMSMIDNNLMIEDPNDADTIETIYGELMDESIVNADRSEVKISVFLSEDRNPAEILSYLRERFAFLGIAAKIETVGRKESDWAEVWKKYYRPIPISRTVTVVPVWEKYEAKDGEKLVFMDPGMAFGSGTHETTRLCAALIEDYMKPGDRVLDVGTGSGILAISAAKLGAGKVNAYDIDPVAVRIAGENVVFNGVGDTVNCGVSDLLRDVDLSEGPYDFVSANIVADIILRMADDISGYVKENGLLAVSGIIERQADEVEEKLVSEGFELIDRRTERDWNSLLLKKRAQ